METTRSTEKNVERATTGAHEAVDRVAQTATA